MTTAAERMRALLKQQEETQKKPSQGGDIFPHWDGEVGSTITIRLLPDGDAGNPFFWRSKCTRKIPFSSIKGMDTGNKKISVVIPAMTTGTKQFTPNFLGAEEYQIDKSQDPIQDQISGWWDQGAEMQEEYRKYKRTWQHFFQGFIRNPGTIVEEDVKSPIRRLNFNDGLYKAVHSLLMQDDLQVLPNDFERGRDFKITISQNGRFKDYNTSWALSESTLTDVEIQALENHELYDLKKFLPKAPSSEELEVIMEMFEASVAGLPYEPDRWSKFYRPQGIKLETNTHHQVPPGVPSDSTDPDDEEPAPKATNSLLDRLKNKTPEAPKEDPKETPKSEPKAESSGAASGTKSSSADLLAMLEKRKREKAAQG